MDPRSLQNQGSELFRNQGVINLTIHGTITGGRDLKLCHRCNSKWEQEEEWSEAQ